MSEKVDIAANLERVKERIADAARRANRDPQEVTLVAVTKAIEPALIQEAMALGLRDFGENRVQEAAEKIPLLQEEGINWHMIGHLQRNKVKKALSLFDLIHSVDSLRLAQEIDGYAGRIGMVMPVLLEVNLSGEASKYGFRLAPSVTDEAERETFFAYVEEVIRLPNLQVRGLMTMAPLVSQPEEARPYFSGLRRLQDELRQRFPQLGWEELSMGMSDDFEVAVEEGATMVRLGRAIFGERRA